MSIKKITRLIGEIEKQVTVCKRCGMCLAVCPLYAETGSEADVARGKLALIDGLVQEMFEDPDGVLKRLNRCLLCGSCAANCPRNVSVLEIFIKARAIITGFTGLSLIKKAALRWCLSYPKLFDKSIKRLFHLQKIFAKPTGGHQGTYCARRYSLFLQKRHFMPIQKTSFHQTLPLYYLKSDNLTKSRIKVAFFTGCLIDKVLPNIACASIDVLRYHDVSVFTPKEQGCCGIPALSSGDSVTFERLVQYSLKSFNTDNFDYLITSCATCAFTIKKIWPIMAHGSNEIKARVEALAKKTIDICQFLDSKVGIKKIAAKEDNPVYVTYHDPCHLKKSLGVWAEPRAVICANKNFRLIEMPNADRCCGAGGSFNLEYYEISEHIGQRKKKSITASGCRVVASGCPACIIQISDLLSKAKVPVSVKHPVEIYAESANLLAIEAKAFVASESGNFS